jgi:hypothetical protein
MKRIQILLSVIFISLQVWSQTLTVHLPAHAGDSVFIVSQAGLKRDTVSHSLLDKKGFCRLKKTTSLPGICFLQINKDVNFAFIWSEKENPEIHCEEVNLHAGNVVFRNSPENDSINGWFSRQQIDQERLGFWKSGLLLYENESTQHAFLEKEIQALEEQKTAFEKMLAASPLYAARYLQIRTFLDTSSYPLGEYAQDSTACEPFRRYLLDSLDMEALYGSDMWFSLINTAMQLYRDLGNYQERGVFKKSFARDMIYILSRIRKQEVRSSFVADLLEICKTSGWHTEAEEINNYQ